MNIIEELEFKVVTYGVHHSFYTVGREPGDIYAMECLVHILMRLGILELAS